MENQSKSQAQNTLIQQNQIPSGEIKERHLVVASSIAKGDMAYGDGNNNWIQLSPGKVNQFLMTNGSGSAPSWAYHTTQYRFYANRSTTQSIPNTTETTVVFDNVVFDPSSMYNSSTGVLTPAVTGYWILTAGLDYNTASNTTGKREGFLEYSAGGNQFAKQTGPAFNGDSTGVNLSAFVYLQTTDRPVVRAYQSSGGALNIFGATEVFFSGVFISA